MKKFATTTPDPELNIPSNEDGEKRRNKPGQAATSPGGGAPKSGAPKQPVDLERLSREEDQQDDPVLPPDDG